MNNDLQSRTLSNKSDEKSRTAEIHGDEGTPAGKEVAQRAYQSACQEAPKNFRWLISSYSLFKLADGLCNPKTTLTWLLSAAQIPPALIGWLVPIRESGSMLPQLFLGTYVRRLAIRKWVWVAGSILQALAMLAVAGLALSPATNNPTLLGVAVIGLVAIFSLARGLCSIASKDVLGKTVAKARRGRVTGLATSIAGGLSLFAGGLLVLVPKDSQSQIVIAALIAAGASCWLLAAYSYSQITEFAGATNSGKNGFREALTNLHLLHSDIPFRNFVIARALFLVSALSAPWYIVLAREQGANTLNSSLAGLGLFVIADGLASLLSGSFWGKQADLSSRRTMMVAAAAASLLSLLLVAVVNASNTIANMGWLYPAAFFLLGIAHSGVRLGRSTYVVDLAEGNKRTDYVSVSNTVIGALLLLTGTLGLLEPLIGVSGILVALSVAGLAGVALAATLPNVNTR